MTEFLAPALDGADFSDRVEANGLELAYEQFGRDEDPALLLIMGLGTQLTGWPDAFCRALADTGLRVIRFDNRDIGLSSQLGSRGPRYDGARSAFIKSLLGRRIRTAYTLDDMAVRLAQQIGSYGYSACAQPNMGDIPLPAYGYLAGLGELGKHGSLISPELGSSFRLVAVSTDLPLTIDGPKDHGIEDVCASCNICTRFCPGDAIKPEKKEANGVLRWHVDAPACLPWFYKMYGCKICLMVCPLNARGRLKAEFQKVAADIRQVKDAKGMVRLIEQRTGEEYTNLDGDGGDGDGEVSSTDR